MAKTVKLYGLFTMTKKQYLLAQSTALGLLLVLWLWALFGQLNQLLFGIGIPLLILTTIGELLETYFALRQFKR